MNNLVECSWERSDCFAYRCGGCVALGNTSFPGRESCPFFKARKPAPMEGNNPVHKNLTNFIAGKAISNIISAGN